MVPAQGQRTGVFTGTVTLAGMYCSTATFGSLGSFTPVCTSMPSTVGTGMVSMVVVAGAAVVAEAAGVAVVVAPAAAAAVVTVGLADLSSPQATRSADVVSSRATD